MESLLIKGGVPLHGQVHVSGAKNAVLPIMAATLLTREKCVIRNVPDLSDVQFMGKILESLGASVKFEDGTLTVLVRSAAWGTRLRYLAPDFTDRLGAGLGGTIEKLKVKVRSGRG